MTFNGVLLRMFKANFRKYLLCFLCSSFTIMILFTFNTLYTNPDFNDPTSLNSMISSNLHAPRAAILLFAVLFIMYAQSTLMSARQADFGLLMVLGMTRNNIRRLILFESGLVALCSIAAGLLSGIVFTKVFYTLLSRTIDMGDITLSITGANIRDTVLFFTAVYIVVIACSLILALQPGILSLLKSARSADKRLLQGRIPALAGILLLALVAILLAGWSKSSESVLTISMLLCWPAVYLLLSGLGDLLVSVEKRKPKRNYRNLLFISHLKHTFVRFRNINFLITLLVTISIFLGSLMLNLYFTSWDTAAGHNPFTVAYAEIYGKNAISQDTLTSITDAADTPLLSSQTLEVLLMPHPRFLSDEKLNAVAGTSYHVERGSYLNLFLVSDHDGYAMRNEEIPAYDAKVPSGTLHLVSAGSVEEMLFNLVPVAGYQFLIVNHEDYEWIRASVKNGLGQIHLLNFKDWQRTGSVVHNLDKALAQYNREHTERWYDTDKQDDFVFKSTSRLGEYLLWKESSEFGLIIMGFVSLLFFAASCVVLHFGVLNELESERVKYRKLNQIGMTAQEAVPQMKRPLRIIFFLPYTFGALISGFFFICIASITEQAQSLHDIGFLLLTALAVSTVFILFQLLFYLLYTRSYTRRMLFLLGMDVPTADKRPEQAS